MVTVTRATLSHTLPSFVRDVLRENLTDRQDPVRTSSDWIFKGRPEDRDFNPPFVIVEMVSGEQEPFGLSKTKRLPASPRVEIQIWARKMSDRDVIGDEAVELLITPSSADADSKTFATQKIVLKNVRDINEDRLVSTHPKPFRIKRIRADVKYIGT